MAISKKELEQIIQDGEGYRFEFKESAAHLDKEMVAFANGSGGRILIGVSDDGTVKGVEIDNKLKSQIQDIANNCEPPVKIIFGEVGKVLVVEVREGIDKPCQGRCA
ncbi:MAG TPA: ATP-binding protein [Candidatus Wallbacteria bacterium]|nr:MAG: Divergent AAA domain protein [bacterium ADurb.Bin243]HPG56299.1 ATP-binding protein [Candidatus Wallbacteria bacterium]